MKADDRFYIDEENLEYISGLCPRKYRVILISLGDILRDYEDGLYQLDRAIPFRYLNDKRYLEEYIRYCSLPRNRIGDEARSPEAFEGLLRRINQNGYDMREGAIVVDQFGIIIEGQHRCCILMHRYGKEYVIPVVQIFRPIRNPRTILRLIRIRRGKVGD